MRCDGPSSPLPPLVLNGKRLTRLAAIRPNMSSSTTTPTSRSAAAITSSSSSSSVATLTRTESEPAGDCKKYEEDLDGERKVNLKPLKGLLKKSASEGCEKKTKRVKFSETMMVFCDDWPEELMPQIIALKSPTDFNLIEVATQGYMFEPPAEYQDLLPFDPPPDYRDCGGNNASVSMSAYDEDESIDYIDDEPPDGEPNEEIGVEEDGCKLTSNLNWENMILNESELLEEDAIIGVLKEDDILQAIGSHAADVDTVFHPCISEHESHEEQEPEPEREAVKCNDSEPNNNNDSSSDANNNGPSDRISLASEASETYSEAEELSSSPTGSLQDIASDSSFTSQDTIILMTNAIINENNRRQAECQNNSELGLSYSSVKNSESADTEGHIDSEAESTDTVLEVRNDFESDFESVDDQEPIVRDATPEKSETQEAVEPVAKDKENTIEAKVINSETDQVTSSISTEERESAEEEASKSVEPDAALPPNDDVQKQPGTGTISSSVSVSEIRKAFERHLTVDSVSNQMTARPKSFPCSAHSKEAIKSLEALQLSADPLLEPKWKAAKDVNDKSSTPGAASGASGRLFDSSKEDLIIEYTSEPKALVPSKRTASFATFPTVPLNSAIYRPVLIATSELRVRSPNSVNLSPHSPHFSSKVPPPPYDHPRHASHRFTAPQPHPRSVSLKPQPHDHGHAHGAHQEQADTQNHCVSHAENKAQTHQQYQHQHQTQLMAQREMNHSPHPQPPQHQHHHHHNQQQQQQQQQQQHNHQQQQQHQQPHTQQLLRPQPPIRTTSQLSPVPQRQNIPSPQLREHVIHQHPQQYSHTLPLPPRQVILIPHQQFHQIRQQIQRANQSQPIPNSPQRCASVPPRSPVPYLSAVPQSRMYQQPLLQGQHLTKETDFPNPSEIRRRDGLNAYPHVWEEPPKPGELPVPPVEPSKLNQTINTKDELELFVQQDRARTERLKKRYSLAEEDDPTFGFGKRPSVRGVKTKFAEGSSKEQPDGSGEKAGSLPPQSQQQLRHVPPGQQHQHFQNVTHLHHLQQQQHQQQPHVSQQQILLHIHHPNIAHQHQHGIQSQHEQQQPRHVYLIPHQGGPQYQQRLVQVGATLPRVSQQQILQLRQSQGAQQFQQVRLRQKTQHPPQQSHQQLLQKHSDQQQQQQQQQPQQQQQHQSQPSQVVHQVIQRPASSLGEAQFRTVRGQDGLLLQVFDPQSLPAKPVGAQNLPSLLQYKTISMPNVAMIKNAPQLTIIPIKDERGTPEGASSSPKHSSDTGYAVSPSNSKTSSSSQPTGDGCSVNSTSGTANNSNSSNSSGNSNNSNNNPDLVKDATRATCSSKSSASSQGSESSGNSGTKSTVKTLSGKEGVIYYSMNV